MCLHSHVMAGMWKSEDNLGYVSSPCLRQCLAAFFFLLCIPGQLDHELLRFLLCLPPISLKGHEDFKCVSWVLYGLWDYTHIFYFCVANISHTEPFPQL